MSKRKRKHRLRDSLAKPRGQVTLPRMNGDLGPATTAARRASVVEKIDDVNNVYRRRHGEPLDQMIATGSLTMAQQQAAEAIRDAYCRVQMLTSGGEIKERVQSSPKPDASVAAQVDATSRFIHLRKCLTASERAIVDHVCAHGQPLRTLPGLLHVRSGSRFREALDKVAVHVGISARRLDQSRKMC